MTLYDLTVKDAEGNDVSLSEYKGKVLLIVNTATGCGFTPQYEALELMYRKYKEQGLEVLDFPCNQFGNQAPGTNAEIADFCSARYGVTFKQFLKIEVNGPGASPLYTYLKSQKSGTLNSNIKWNFTKFLIDRDGNVVARYAPAKKPESIESDVVKLL